MANKELFMLVRCYPVKDGDGNGDDDCANVYFHEIRIGGAWSWHGRSGGRLCSTREGCLDLCKLPKKGFTN